MLPPLVAALACAALPLLAPQWQHALAQSYGEPDQTLRVDSLNGASRVADVNQSVPLRVRVTDAAGRPLAGVPVDWSLERESPAGIGDGSLTGSRVTTGADGVAVNTLSTGTIPEQYRVLARVSLQGSQASQSFQITVGIEATARPGTPEAAVGGAVDRLCPQLNIAADLNAGEEALRNRCNALVQAAGGGEEQDAEVAAALRQLSPEESVIQSRTGQQFGLTQVGNISTRLAALRAGIRGVSLQGLAFNSGGQRLPAHVIASLLSGEGGGAGDGGLLDSRLGIFINGEFGGGERDGTELEEGFDFDTRGITAGVDYRFSDDLVAGLALGYADAQVDIDGDGGDMDADGWSLSLYGSHYVNDNLYLDGIVGYGSHDYQLDRNIDYSLTGIETVATTAAADTDGTLFSASLGGGYETRLGEGISLIGLGRLTYTETEVEGYTESGASGLEVQVDDQDLESLTLTLGGEVSRAISTHWGVVVPRLRLEYEREFEDSGVNISGRFVNDRFNNTFQFTTDELDDDYFRLGAGFSTVFSGGRSAFLYYETLLGRDEYSEYNITAGLRFEF